MPKTLMEVLGIELLEMTEEKVVATMPVDGRTHQPFGFLHGGASVALAETVASVGSYNLIDQEKCICFGLEINANHLRSKREGLVTAIGTPIHKGQTTMVWDVRIIDEEDQLLCISRCTVAIKEKRSQ
ncbi:hotdog fold thioesterase [Bacillus sp. DX1.1]|uniref:hotdog fold thioesterase n=1 Tax=unclassified Bacillus (in: firmicutes) TaxID=185979 RepID=UPI0025709090|nr:MULTISPECIES: hotdog fold thioesterase [unclassified Bacillus (in: firmicutes)]MDM5157035.1 hotdog fold thioesterase [Bacillus sp. DX1.1]WJE81272.1 hotdog fold thioesterase [Bacillus sp. DX3.1]